MKTQQDAEVGETIEVSNEWYNRLNAVPFVSCKFDSLACQPHYLFRIKREDAFPSQVDVEARELIA
jgi:hypothetical protein